MHSHATKHLLSAGHSDTGLHPALRAATRDQHPFPLTYTRDLTLGGHINELSRAGYQPMAYQKESSLHQMDLSFFPRSVKSRQVLSDTPKDLTRPLGCNSRPCCAFLLHASQGSSVDSAAGGPRSWEVGRRWWRGGVETRRVRGVSGPGPQLTSACAPVAPAACGSRGTASRSTRAPCSPWPAAGGYSRCAPPSSPRPP